MQEVEAEALNHDRKGSGQHPFVEGVLCNLLNPKLAVFLLSLFTQFLSPEASFSEKLLVASIFVGESLLYWPLLVFFLQSRQVQFGFARFQHLADRVFGALLLGVGIRVALSDR